MCDCVFMRALGCVFIILTLLTDVRIIFWTKNDGRVRSVKLRKRKVCLAGHLDVWMGLC